MKGKERCRIHGGKSTGAPKGEANGSYRHGGCTGEAIALRRKAAALMDVVSGRAALPEPDRAAVALLLGALANRKLTRAEKRERNQAAWASRDRRRWGGEDRRRWPKHPGRNGYRGIA